MPLEESATEDKNLQVDLILYNGKIYTPKGFVEAGIAIEKGRIFKVAKETNLPKASSKLNLNGHIVLPGLIDSHVHLRGQNRAYREDFFTGTAAAAAGGFSVVMDMPNNKPVTMDVQSLRERMKLAEKRVLVNVAFYSAFPETLKEIRSVVREGAVAFKLFLLEKIGGLNIDDDTAVLRGFSEVKKANVPVAVHAEDKDAFESKMKRMQNENRNDIDAYLEAHSSDVEVKAVQRIIGLAEKSEAHVHFCHISSAKSLNLIRRAKGTGVNITCEVTPHHLLLTTQDLKRYKNLAVTLPPARTGEDMKALWDALKQSLIDTLGSDHAPHVVEEKKPESVWEVKPGIAGLETTLPLMLTKVNKGRLTIAELVQLTSKKPAEIFRLNDRGTLSKGCYADLVVVDIKREHKIDSSRFHSKAKFSPFDGWKVKGK
ncbi:MAG: dihydroorotase family protein, partial [Candidatus Bathyarchaeota archaeon]|nr:dihydroorotase family protein [Candidatus Bathyarchaeota archaeon]